MQLDISLKRELVERVNLFSGLTLACLVEVVSKLAPIIALPDEYVIVQGEQVAARLIAEPLATLIDTLIATLDCHTACRNDCHADCHADCH